MDGSVRVIKGPDTGASCKLKPGVNIIGRSSKAALTLTSPDVSWEHFSITCNGDQYTVENLSAMGTYLDEAKITGQIKLRSRDLLRISQDTVIRFEGGGGALDSGLLAGARGVALLIGLGIAIIGGIVMMVLSSQTTKPKWPEAYARIEAWVSQEIDTNINPDLRLPPETLQLFQDAWAKEQAADYTGANKSWLRLRLLLDHLEDEKKLPADSPDNANALNKLLVPPPGPKWEPSDDEMAAAFRQFVSRWLAWNTLQIKSSKS